METDEAYDWAINQMDEDATFIRMVKSKAFNKGLQELNNNM